MSDTCHNVLVSLICYLYDLLNLAGLGIITYVNLDQPVIKLWILALGAAVVSGYAC